MVKITLKNGRKANVTETQAKALRAMGYLAEEKAPKVEPKPEPVVEVAPVPVKRVYRRRSVTPAVTAVMQPEQ